jgi:hypothetical protein
MALLPVYMLIGILVIIAGDRSGYCVRSCLVRKRRCTPVVCRLGWACIPASLMVSGLLLAGILAAAIKMSAANPPEALPDTILIFTVAGLFVTGFFGGLFGRKKQL